MCMKCETNWHLQKKVLNSLKTNYYCNLEFRNMFSSNWCNKLVFSLYFFWLVCKVLLGVLNFGTQPRGQMEIT